MRRNPWWDNKDDRDDRDDNIMHNDFAGLDRGTDGREIVGTEGDDILRGTNKDDTISSGRGDDVVYGKGGDDSIDTHDGFFTDDDKVFGGKGDDTISLGRGADIADGGKGDDDITLNFPEPLLPYLGPDAGDTILFSYGAHDKGFGHDTIHAVQEDDALVFLDRSGNTENLEDLDAMTRLVDVGENAYRIDWLDSGQSVTLNLDNEYLNFGQLPEDQVSWDDFTTLEELAGVVDFRFDADYFA